MSTALHQSLVAYMKDEMAWESLVALHNNYVVERLCGTGYIYSHCTELVTELGVDAEEAMRMLFFGKVDNWFDYVKLNPYENIVSVRSDEDFDESLDTLAEWVLDTGKAEFTIHLELHGMEWENDDNDPTIYDKEAMARWVSDSEDYEGDRERLFDELMADGYWWVEWHKVEAD